MFFLSTATDAETNERPAAMTTTDSLRALLSSYAVTGLDTNLSLGGKIDISPEKAALVAGAGCAAEWVMQAADVAEVASWKAPFDTASGDEEYLALSFDKQFGRRPTDEETEAFRAEFVTQMRGAVAKAQEEDAEG